MMALANKQRKALIATKGQPELQLEFDVWSDGNVSMWTHFNHGCNFNDAKKRMIAIRDHIDSFIQDSDMCPFHHIEIE